MATRKQLLDQNDNEILPITDTESVRNPQSIGGSLESRLATVENTANNALQSSDLKTINNQSIVGSGNINIESGGTDDYTDLDNKPQINSVTLSGNKSATDLGLATATQGVLADTAYQKPQSGIPSDHLAGEVQTSLGKAETAVQQVAVDPNTVTGNAGTFHSICPVTFH